MVSLVFTLSGCGPAKQDGGETAETKDGGGTKLTLWVHADINKKYYEAVAEEFKKTHPDVKVDIALMDTKSISDKYTIIINSGGEGAPDLLDVEQGIFPNFIRGEVPFMPLDDDLKRDNLTHVMSEGRQALYTVDGKQYGIEAAACVSALYYRKDLYDQAGIDVAGLKTWDEFTEASKKLIGDGKFIFPGGNDQSTFELLLRQEGGDIVTEDGKIGVNTPEALAALKRIHAWKELGIMEREAPEGPAYWEAFNSGRYIAAFGPDWWGNILADQVPDLSGKWAAVPMPLGGPNSFNTTVWGGTGLSISKFTKQKDLAWEFLKLAQLTPEMVEKSFQIRNQFPALITALDQPGLHEKSKYTEYFGGQDLGALYGELVKKAPRQNQAWWRPLIGQAWEKYYFDYNEGKMEPETFLSQVEKELQHLIAAEEAKQK